MNTYKILDSEIHSLKVGTLPKRPTAATAYGGEGYSSYDMKAAFDRLPMFLVERFNSLINDIETEGEGKISESIKTGLFRLHSLDDFFSDLKNGNLASYMTVGDSTLLERLAALEEAVSELQLTLAALTEQAGTKG